MRIIGLDLGSKTVGVAISDELLLLARPLTTLHFEEDNYDLALELLLDLAKNEGVFEFVLGLPKHMNNDTGIRANISINFAEKLKNLGFICHLVDERLSTITVKNMLSLRNQNKQFKQKKDEFAAVVILQKYLDKRGIL